MVESKNKWKAWLYLAPAILLLLVFTVWPIVNTVRMAFLEGYSGLNGEVVRYSVKPHKLFVFHKETEKRLAFEVK